MKVKMISIDASTSASGVSEYINGKYRSSIVLKTDPKIKGDEKLNQMIKLIFQYLSQKKLEIIVVETIVPTRNAMGTRMLQELTGSIRGYCIYHDIDYYSLRPTEWRKAVVDSIGIKPKGRKRADQKEWALDIVNNKLNIKTDSDDEAESILLGLGYINLFK